MQLVEQRNLQYSIVLHVAAVLFLLVGIPVLLPTPAEPTPMVMSVEVLPISEMSNVKPSEKPIQKEQHAPVKQVKTPPTPPPPPSKPKDATPPPPPDKTPPKPEKVFDPMEGAEPVKQKPKPPEPEKEKPKPAVDDFMKTLDALRREEKAAADKPLVDKTPAKAAPTPTPAKNAKDATNTEENKTTSDAPYDPSKSMSMSEKDAFRGQFRECWNMPSGAKDAKSLVVHVKVKVLEDGTVQDAAIGDEDMGRYGQDVVYRAAADSAKRAVYKCSPLKFLPHAPYNSWSTMTLTFTPDMAL